MSAALDISRQDVVRVHDISEDALVECLTRFALRGTRVHLDESVPGSYWGESEAGLVGDTVYWRTDTPVHSVLHEASHAICMDPHRRASLNRDAGGDFEEENAVCYLQILLADLIPGVGRARMWHDMDGWGYTFRLGSARAWFEHDASDARQWLIDHRLIDEAETVAWRKREG